MAPSVGQRRRRVHAAFGKGHVSAASTSGSEPLAWTSTTARTSATSGATGDGVVVNPLPPMDCSFTTVEELLARIESVAADVDALTVAGVGPAQFAAVDEALAARGRKTRLFFLAEGKMLIITIPTKAHERLHTSLYRVAINDLDQEAQDEWCDDAAARLPQRQSPGGSQGEGDSSGGPRQRYGADAWPTLVVEAGFSQSLLSLRAKMRCWFGQSNHQVQIVVLAKAFPQDSAAKRILIEQWVEQVVAVADAHRSTRPGVVTRRAAAAAAASAPRLEPVCIQTINIVWAEPGGASFAAASVAQRMDPNSFVVARGPLRLDFARLFLQHPGPGQRDVVVPEDRLRLYASNVWLADMQSGP